MSVMPRMNIDQIRLRRLDFSMLVIFRDLVRQQKTTIVAAQLGLSQSAISHALSRLREVLGDPLFVRRPSGLEPTLRALATGARLALAEAYRNVAVTGAVPVAVTRFTDRHASADRPHANTNPSFLRVRGRHSQANARCRSQCNG